MQKLNNLIFTFTVSQWYCMPDAMQRMAEVAHGENIPVSWQISYLTALEEKELLDGYHAKYGDEIVIIKGEESFGDWRKIFPWAKLNIVGRARPEQGLIEEYTAEGITGIWGYCDQQIGPDGITHWGCPWGMFHISEKTTFIPASHTSTMIGTPWTLRDLHKCYHLKQAINFCTDPIDNIRSRTLDRGENITFFQDLFDELKRNLPWNEKVYCCIHEEANGPFIFPGCKESDEGATPEESVAMYEMIRQWIRYAKSQGANIMTLPQAVDEYRETSNGLTIPSTIITRDKHHGRLRHYVVPFPDGIEVGDFGPSGNYPDTLFHYDNECQLVFVHPELTPRTILNYKAQHEVKDNRPYPEEQAKPCLLHWESKREKNFRTYRYNVQSWYRMPYGLAEWGDFENWEIEETNCSYAKIIDKRILLMRMELEPKGETPQEINTEMMNGFQYWVRLKKV